MNYTVKWCTGIPLKNLPVDQIYGILFNEQGSVLILNDAGTYNLPGGHPEEDEDWLQTLARECMEEAQAELSNPMFLGYVLVDESGDHHQRSFVQLRFVAAIAKLLPQAPDPANGKSYGREFYPPATVAELLQWGEHGDKQLQAAEALWQIIKTDDRANCRQNGSP